VKVLFCIALGLATVALLAAQTGNRKVTQNKLSPTADTSITVGGHKITIEYNAPSARGRKVEGGLIPYDKVWRFGADSATTITTEADLTIGGLKVPKGAHTLFILASESGWKLIVNNQTGQWGLTYKEDQDLGRVPLELTKLGAPVETLKITLESSGDAAGTLKFQWGNTQAAVGIQ
jgi:hypothetical protein